MSNVIPLRPVAGTEKSGAARRDIGIDRTDGTVVYLRIPSDDKESPTIRLTAAELNAYVDGALSDEHRLRIDQIVRTDPEAAALVRHYRQQMDELHRLYDPVLTEPVPQAMRDLLSQAGRKDPDNP